jgi:ArsR family transcriptional regulator
MEHAMPRTTSRARAARRARGAACARLFKALAHPCRVGMLAALAEGPRHVGELAAHAGVGMATASQHLRVLRGAGLVTDTKRGLQVHYAIAQTCITTMLACATRVINNTIRAQSALTDPPKATP